MMMKKIYGSDTVTLVVMKTLYNNPELKEM